MPEINLEKCISKGIFNGLLNYFALVGISALAINYASELFMDKDSTDSEDDRSGMSLHIDSLTGCHYLYKGSLTPRINSNGTHYGCGDIKD